MKFGLTLYNGISSEWHPYSVDYKGLKQVLKGGCAVHDNDDPATIDKNEFFRVYEQSKSRLGLFYSEREKVATGKMESIEERVRTISRSHSSEGSIRGLVNAMDSFQEDLDDLAEFLKLNKTGFSKILKKFDKNTGMCVREEKLEELMATHQFLEGKRLLELKQQVVESHERVRDILETRESGQGNLEEDFPNETGESDEIPPKRRRVKQLSMIARVSQELNTLATESFFFAENRPQELPAFKHREIYRGSLLGEGEFGTVREISEFRVPESCHVCFFHRTSLPNHMCSDTVARQKNDVQFPKEARNRARLDSLFLDNVGSQSTMSAVSDTVSDIEEFLDDHDDDTLHVTRGFMKDHCMCEESARYAIKNLREDLAEEWHEVAARDIAVEAKFLATLTHPNIVKMRATGGVPGHRNFFIVLDRLYGTFTEKRVEWAMQVKNAQGRFFTEKKLFIGKDKAKLQKLWIDRLVAIFDVARAMRYIHRHNILFRDLKPDNIGFDIRGDAKIFDFGLAKELLSRDKVGEDQFRLSGTTGSRRYMAPEVAMCKPYGFSVDVYSFAIVLWEMLALDVPFPNYGYEKHSRLVVLKGRRPKIPSSWPALIRNITKEAWSPDPSLRPGFSRICDLLRGEVELNDDFHLTDRSQDLINLSYESNFMGPSTVEQC